MTRSLVSAAVVVLWGILAVQAQTDTATEQVRRYTDQVLQVLDDPALTMPQRQAAVRTLALELFDPAETARRALGRHWQARTPAEREEFTRLFVALLDRTYLTRLGLYKGERVTYVGETVNGGFAVVRAKVLLRGQLAVPVEARLLRRGERWYAYDVALEGISLVGNYRAQFDKIIQTSSYEELVARLRAKAVASE